MLDIVLTVILITLTFIISLNLDADSTIIQAAVNVIPLAILTFRLYYNHPKNYFHFIGLLNRNVKYLMNIQLTYCNIDKDQYLTICDKLNRIYIKPGKIIRQNMGQFIYKTYLEVDSSLVEVTYHLEDCTLHIEEKSKTKFRVFASDVEKILANLIESFSKSDYNYNSELISIELNFLNRHQDEKRNPFYEKFFSDFYNSKMRLTFSGSEGSNFDIRNSSIIITSKSMKSIKDDIKKEMLLY